MIAIKHLRWYIILLLSFNCIASFGQLRLPHYYTNHMVLQRDKPVKFWGWNVPGKGVSVRLNGKLLNANAGIDSVWTVMLPVMKAGGPYTISVQAGADTVSINDIYFGDVWFCGGQSNMNFRMRQIMNHDKELADADYPLIRTFNVPLIGAEEPQKDVLKSNWLVAGQQTIDNFSAVAFQFAKNVFKATKVPIGLINTSWGGSPIETFMSPESLKDFPSASAKVKSIRPGFIQATKQANTDKIKQWEQNFANAAEYIDANRTLNGKAEFFNTDDSWKPVTVPGFVDDQGIAVKKGISWYKKEFTISEIPSTAATIDLGRINFASFTYLNGVYIGIQPNPYYNAKFKLSSGLLKKGINEVLVCGYNDSDKTGFRPIAKQQITIGGQSISLSGEWLYKQGKVFDKAGALGAVVTLDFEHGYPALAYNAVIHPFFNYAVKGCLWYQGEANATIKSCFEYEVLLTSLIKSWRQSFNNNALPFYMVQIANYGPVSAQPKASPWAVVQEAQTKVSNAIINSGIAITNDVGNALDVHPTNKQEVGRRLALVALKNAYGQTNLTAEGPVLKSVKIQQEGIVLSFDNVDDGIQVKGGGNLLEGFAVCGDDNKFYWAQAKVEGNKVIVSCPQVSKPLHVRYAFESSPAKINFYNKQGLPAVPFRTDKLTEF
ncbi:sialate O-acetylesterase [uncultured Mucilaginibacter sp.]|uniref:sialate O-acetylesterase n=1 Tax=uncultured Mucilaginibacter sp. TaxID=797541 RepID=UPI0025DB580F|nr:sialate O-acetylesterase [uncultured Mucilaginibacter sp.]